MMKILCLLVILANIFLLIWEYSFGETNASKATQEQTAIIGKEPIVLSHEQKMKPRSSLPIPTRKVQLDVAKPSSYINETQAYENIPETTSKTNTIESREPQLP